MADTNGSSVDAFFYQYVLKGKMTMSGLTKLIVLTVLVLFSVYVNCVILYILNSKPAFKESSRYILFAHMLFIDAVHLLLTFFLFFFAVIFLKMAKAVCSIILLLNSATFYNAPINLAVMSLERYVAICFPLRHIEIATQKRTFIAICFVWLIGCVNIVIDIIVTAVMDPNFFYIEKLCAREQLLMQPWQYDMFSGFVAFLFLSVMLIIVFTYISIMITARSVSSNKDSAKQAHKTVLLHFIQLALCTSSIFINIIDRALYIVAGNDTLLFLNLQYLNFLLILILPRCLSPLIYGLRDDAVRPLFKYHFCCCSRKSKIAVNVH